MDYKKLQNDVLKDFIKYPNYEDRGLREIQGLAKYNNYICALTKYAIYMIPEEKFFLDYEKLVNASKDFTDSIGQMLQPLKHIESAIKKDEVIELDKSCKCNIFHLPISDTEVYINKKFLSYYEDKKGEYHYSGSDAKSPIFIYDFYTDDLIGFVLPINPNFIKK